MGKGAGNGGCEEERRDGCWMARCGIRHLFNERVEKSECLTLDTVYGFMHGVMNTDKCVSVLFNSLLRC